MWRILLALDETDRRAGPRENMRIYKSIRDFSTTDSTVDLSQYSSAADILELCCPGRRSNLHKPQSDKESMNQADYNIIVLLINNPSAPAISLLPGHGEEERGGEGSGRLTKGMQSGHFANKGDNIPSSSPLKLPTCYVQNRLAVNL